MNLPDFKRLIRPITNKIFLLLGRAVLNAIENSEDTQKLKVLALSDEVINDIERFQEYGFETYPFADSEVFIGFLNGNRDHGIALVVHDDRHRLKDLVEGEVAVYTDEDSETGGHRIHFKRGQIIEQKSLENIIDADEVSLGGDTFASLRTLVDSRFITLFNNHVHSQPNDSDGDVQQNTSVPTVLSSEANQATAKVKGI